MKDIDEHLKISESDSKELFYVTIVYRDKNEISEWVVEIGKLRKHKHLLSDTYANIQVANKHYVNIAFNEFALEIFKIQCK